MANNRSRRKAPQARKSEPRTGSARSSSRKSSSPAPGSEETGIEIFQRPKTPKTPEPQENTQRLPAVQTFSPVLEVEAADVVVPRRALEDQFTQAKIQLAVADALAAERGQALAETQHTLDELVAAVRMLAEDPVVRDHLSCRVEAQLGLSSGTSDGNSAQGRRPSLIGWLRGVS